MSCCYGCGLCCPCMLFVCRVGAHFLWFFFLCFSVCVFRSPVCVCLYLSTVILCAAASQMEDGVVWRFCADRRRSQANSTAARPAGPGRCGPQVCHAVNADTVLFNIIDCGRERLSEERHTIASAEGSLNICAECSGACFSLSVSLLPLLQLHMGL